MTATHTPLKWGLAIALNVVALAGGVYFVTLGVTRNARETASDFATAVKETLNLTPKVSVNNTVILEASAPVLELVSTKRQFQHRMHWDSTWLGSTKSITLAGQFTASVWFDLRDEFSVNFDSRTRAVQVRLPPAKVLAVQMDSIDTQQQTGWWNAITDADRTSVINAFSAEARGAVQKSRATLTQAEENLRQQMHLLLAKSSYRVTFISAQGGKEAKDAKDTEGTPEPTPIPASEAAPMIPGGS
jgi:hypothetical protein